MLAMMFKGYAEQIDFSKDIVNFYKLHNGEMPFSRKVNGYHSSKLRLSPSNIRNLIVFYVIIWKATENFIAEAIH